MNTQTQPSGFDPASIPPPEAVLRGDALSELRGAPGRKLEALLLLCPSQQRRPRRMDIEIALGVSAKELNALCYQLAAELRAQGLSWASIAAHPAQYLKRDTLEKGHPTASIPGGGKFADYVAAYQQAYQAGLEELARSSGERAAQEMHSLALTVKRILGKLAANIEMFIDHPPGGFGWQPTLAFADGGQQQLPEQLSIQGNALVTGQAKDLVSATAALDGVLRRNTPGAADSKDDQPSAPTNLDSVLDKLEANEARLGQLAGQRPRQPLGGARA